MKIFFWSLWTWGCHRGTSPLGSGAFHISLPQAMLEPQVLQETRYVVPEVRPLKWFLLNGNHWIWGPKRSKRFRHDAGRPAWSAWPCVYLYSSHWQSINSNTDSILQDVLTHRCAGAYGEHWMAWTTGSLLVLLPESPVWKKVEKQETWWAGELKWGDTIWSSYWRFQGPTKFETQITKNAAELRINLLKFTLLWSMKFHSYLKVINQSTSIFTRLKPHETTTSSIFLCYKLASCFQNKVKVSLGGGTYRLAILDKAHGVQDNPIPMMAKWREATNSMMNLPFRAGRKVGTSIIDETQSYPK